MTRKLPNSKSIATVTARSCEAIAADLEHVVTGFRKAAELYRSGDYKLAQETADAALEASKMPLSHWARML